MRVNCIFPRLSVLRKVVLWLDSVLVEDVVLNRSPEASEKLLARAEIERVKAESAGVRFLFLS